MVSRRYRVEPFNMRRSTQMQHSRRITTKEFFKLLIAVAIPVSIGFYTAVTNEQVQRSTKLAAQEEHHIATERRAFDLARAQELYQQQLYKNFLDDMYTLHKDGQLDEEAAPWAFANARYRAAHREFDTIRKVEALQFLKERKLLGCRMCTKPCWLKNATSIVYLDGLNLNNLILNSGIGNVSKLDLTCVEFYRVSIINVTFSNVDLSGIIINNSQLNSTKFEGSSLNDSIIESTDLDGTNFTDSTMKGIEYVNIDTSKLNLTDTQKEQAGLTMSTPSRVNMTTTSTTHSTGATSSRTTTTTTTTTTYVINSTYSNELTTQSEQYPNKNKYYQAIQIMICTSGTYVFSSSSSFDAVGYLYNGTFHPSNPNSNLVISNDDSGVGLQFQFSATLQACTMYTFALTTYRNNTTGRYSITVQGPNNVHFVPIYSENTKSILNTATTSVTHSTIVRNAATTTTTTTTTYVINSTYSNELTTQNEQYPNENKYYQEIRIMIYTSGTYVFSSSSSFDAVGYLYNGTFHPSNRSTNLVISNDDGGVGLQFQLSTTLQACTMYTFVVTAYRKNTTGRYSISVQGPNNIHFVPIYSENTKPNSCSTNSIVNGGFESGNHSDWLIGGGSRTSLFFNEIQSNDFLPNGKYYNATIATTHSRIVNKTNDSILNNSNTSTVHEGRYALRMGDGQAEGHLSIAGQRINNYSCNDIYFAWLAVLADTSEQNDAGFIMIKMEDVTAGKTLINETYFGSTNSAGNSSKFLKTLSHYYTPKWQIEHISLDASSRGHDFQLSILVADCKGSAHFGYAYIDSFGMFNPTKD